jgi:hypothetical protein
MKSALTTVALAIATAALIVAILGDGRELPPRPVSIVGTIFVYGAPPPATPEEMLREADAVIVASYTGQHRLIERREGRFPWVYSTNYQFEIVETLKVHRLLPTGSRSRIDVRLHGGDRELPTRIERIVLHQANALQPDHTYVVFFARNWKRPELYLAWGAAGLYDITGKIVEPVERLNRRYADRSVAAFLGDLRKARSR